MRRLRRLVDWIRMPLSWWPVAIRQRTHCVGCGRLRFRGCGPWHSRCLHERTAAMVAERGIYGWKCGWCGK